MEKLPLFSFPPLCQSESCNLIYDRRKMKFCWAHGRGGNGEDLVFFLRMRHSVSPQIAAHLVILAHMLLSQSTVHFAHEDLKGQILLVYSVSGRIGHPPGHFYPPPYFVESELISRDCVRKPYCAEGRELMSMSQVWWSSAPPWSVYNCHVREGTMASTSSLAQSSFGCLYCI